MDSQILGATLIPITGFLIGLVVGSFINVVVYRLPIMLEREWFEQVSEFLRERHFVIFSILIRQRFNSNPKLNLAHPRSHCTLCKNQLKYYELIPMISFILQQGRCNSCNKIIPVKYPSIEFLAGIMTGYIGVKFGLTLTALITCLFVWTLLTLSCIDLETKILPDQLTLPLLWVGLVINTQGLFVPAESAVFGALGGYIALRLTALTFKFIRKKEGLGEGDIKLVAALGAWVGIDSLPFLVGLAAVSALGFKLITFFMLNDRKNEVTFGPYLSFAGFVCLLSSQNLQQLGFGV